VIVGASLPWQDFTWMTGLQAIGLLLVRAAAKAARWRLPAAACRLPKRLLVATGIQPLSATAIFMAYEIAGLYPEIGRSALALSLFSAAVMELAGPALCRFALRKSGETGKQRNRQGRHRMSTALGEFRHSEPLTLGVELELQLLSGATLT
jgi:hypothetical protein